MNAEKITTEKAQNESRRRRREKERTQEKMKGTRNKKTAKR
jgi:hypothetical protein